MLVVKLTITSFENRPAKSTAAIRDATKLPSWGVRLEHDGAVGYGEAYLWPGFGSTEETIRKDFKRAERTLSDLATPEVICAWLEAPNLLTSPAQYALELACFDLLGKLKHTTVAALLWDNPQTSIPCHTTLDAWSDLQRPRRWAQRPLKLKVGKLDPADEYAYLNDVLTQHPSIRLRLDANGAWSLTHAQRMCALTAAYPNVIVEQPLPADAFESLANLQRQTTTVIALDESFILSPAQSLSTGCLEMVVKPMYAGGLNASKRACNRILTAKRRVCVTHALEGSVGRAGAQHFAAGVPTNGAHGVGNNSSADYVKLKNAYGHGAVQ